jgi:TolB-like protein
MYVGNERAHSVFKQVRLIAFLLFCLINPFVGWIYLATPRERWEKAEAPIGDAVKPKRLAVVPLTSPRGSSTLSDVWLEAVLSGLGCVDNLETLAYPEKKTLDDEQDPLVLGRELDADLVLHASLSIDDEELRLFVRLLRLADDSVIWSQAFKGAPEDLESFCDESVLGVLGTIATQ